jgi:class 3 adenylate cyclase
MKTMRPVPFWLEIVTALDHARNRFPQPVQVRIGIHTGLVVVGQMGAGGLGDFPLAYFSVTHTYE